MNKQGISKQELIEKKVIEIMYDKLCPIQYSRRLNPDGSTEPSAAVNDVARFVARKLAEQLPSEVGCEVCKILKNAELTAIDCSVVNNGKKQSADHYNIKSYYCPTCGNPINRTDNREGTK